MGRLEERVALIIGASSGIGARVVIDRLRATIPRGRFATVDEIVPAYVNLSSDGARHMMGQTISPNGGDVFL